MNARRTNSTGRGPRWPLCIVFLACTAPAPADAAPRDGAELLVEAPIYALVRPALAFDLLGEVDAMLRSSAVHREVFGRQMSRVQRELGFDPTSPDGLKKIGIDPAAPVWAAVGAIDVPATKRAFAQLQRTVSQGLRGGASLDERLAQVPFTAMHSRLIFGVADSARLQGFLGRVGFLAQDEQALTQRLAQRSAPAATATLAGGLAKLGVLGAAWLDPRTLAVVRVVGARRAVVDLVAAWTGFARTLDAGAARGLLKLLALPSRGALDGKHPLVAQAFTADAGAALLLRAAPLATLAELGLEQQLLSSVPYLSGRSAKAIWKAGQAEISRCTRGWRAARALTGDTAVRLTASKRQWQAKIWWALPAGTIRSLSRAVARDAAVDPTAFSSAVAFAGANVEIGKLGQDLAKGPFRKRPRELARLANECSVVTLTTVATGAWLGLASSVLAELKKEPNLAPVASGLRNGVVVLRSLSSARGLQGGDPGALIAHFVVAGGAALRAKLDAAAAGGAASKSALTFGSTKTTVYRDLKGMRDVVLAVTDEPGGAIGVTIAPRQRLADIGWLLSQPRADKGVLPASILAFGHLNVSAVLEQVVASLPGVGREMIGPPLRALSDRVGRLRGNVALDGGRLVGEIILDRK